MKTFVTLPKNSVFPTFFTDENVALAESLGEVVWNEKNAQLSEPEIAESIGDADIYLTGWGSPRLSRAILDSAPNLRLLVHLCGTVVPVVSDEMWDRFFNVNVRGAFNCTQAVLPDMISAKQGNIVTISSIWGLRGASCEVVYSATKAALIGLSKSLAMELAPSGIRVNCIAPGVIDTDMLESLPEEIMDSLADMTPMGRIGRPEDIAGAVAFFAKEEASFITGQVLTADGGFIL